MMHTFEFASYRNLCLGVRHKLGVGLHQVVDGLLQIPAAHVLICVYQHTCVCVCTTVRKRVQVLNLCVAVIQNSGTTLHASVSAVCRDFS